MEKESELRKRKLNKLYDDELYEVDGFEVGDISDEETYCDKCCKIFVGTCGLISLALILCNFLCVGQYIWTK